MWISGIRNSYDFLVSENNFLISENHFLISENRFLISENQHEFLISEIHFLISKNGHDIFCVRNSCIFWCQKFDFLTYTPTKMIAVLKYLPSRNWVLKLKSEIPGWVAAENKQLLSFGCCWLSTYLVHSWYFGHLYPQWFVACITVDLSVRYDRTAVVDEIYVIIHNTRGCSYWEVRFPLFHYFFIFIFFFFAAAAEAQVTKVIRRAVLCPGPRFNIR